MLASTFSFRRASISVNPPSKESRNDLVRCVAKMVCVAQEKFAVVVKMEGPRPSASDLELSDLLYKAASDALGPLNPSLDFQVRFSPPGGRVEDLLISPVLGLRYYSFFNNVEEVLTAKEVGMERRREDEDDEEEERKVKDGMEKQGEPLIDEPHEALRLYPSTLFAGTFDHLHSGHRSVLTRALASASSVLHVGITGGGLLKKKKLPEALESPSSRFRSVQRFLEESGGWAQKLGISVDFWDVEDPVGPARSLDFDCIFVTPETRKGGDLVNQARREEGVAEVEVEVAPLVEGLTGGKVSSTDSREWILGRIPLLSDNEDENEDLEGAPEVSRDPEETQRLKEEVLKDLFAKWMSLCDSLKVCTSVAEAWWSFLRDKFCEPWRSYHSFGHIQDLLRKIQKIKEVNLENSEKYQEVDVESREKMKVFFEKIRKNPMFFEILELSAWFHDLEYNPRSSKNEQNSEKLFRDFAEKGGLENDVCFQVRRIIMATQNHDYYFNFYKNQIKRNEKWVLPLLLFLELDVSIFGENLKKYEIYSKNIRKEYFFVPWKTFREKRTLILENFFKNSVFNFQFLSIFFPKISENAKTNLESEIQGLKKAEKESSFKL